MSFTFINLFIDDYICSLKKVIFSIIFISNHFLKIKKKVLQTYTDKLSIYYPRKYRI